MYLNRKIIVVMSLVLLIIMAACSSVKETSSDEPAQLWTNEVSLNIANEFVGQIELDSSSSPKPVYLVGKIEASQVPDNIAAGLEYDLELTLVNTGKVSFIRNKKKLENERYDRKSISDFETVNDIYEYLNELDVDYFIEGMIKAELSDDAEDSYVVVLRIIDLNIGESSEWQKTVTR